MGKGKTDFVEIAHRFESIIDFSKIKSKEEFEDAVASRVSGNKKAENILGYLDELYEQGGIKKIVEASAVEKEEVVDLRERARRFEAGRAKRSRESDEARTAKDTRRITPPNFKTWRNNPARLDLWRIDTAKGARVSARNDRGSLFAVSLSAGDRRLVNVRPYVDMKRRVKFYKSVSTGQFVPNPWKRRR